MENNLLFDLVDKYKRGAIWFLYKGNPFPLSIEGKTLPILEHYTEKMINSGLDKHMSLKDQITYYKNQLDVLMIKFNQNHNDSVKMSHLYGQKEFDNMRSMWCVNILALLKLNAIENDNMNGILNIAVE
jgi:hypothetical protein